jgi:hypothetical protein
VVGAVVDVRHDDVHVTEHGQVGGRPDRGVHGAQHLAYRHRGAHLLGEAAVQLRHLVAEAVAAHLVQPYEVTLLDEGADGPVDRRQRDAEPPGDRLGGDPVTRGRHRLDHPQRAGDGGTGGACGGCHTPSLGYNVRDGTSPIGREPG